MGFIFSAGILIDSGTNTFPTQLIQDHNSFLSPRHDDMRGRHYSKCQVSLAWQMWNTNWALLPASILTATSQCLWFQQGSLIFVKNMPDAVILDSFLISYWPLKQEIDLWRPLKICILNWYTCESSCLGVFVPLWIYCVFCHNTLSETCMLPLLLHVDSWSMCYLLSVTVVPCPALSVTPGCCESNIF